MLPSRVAVRIFSVGLMVLGAAVYAQDPSTGSGQVFPSKPIRIVTAAAGGGSDFAARLVAQGISGPLGQPVIVENRGSGLVQYEFLAKAPPDGYGLLVTGMSFWVAPLLQKIPYEVINRLSQEVVRALNQPDVKERFLNAGVEVVANSPAEFTAMIKSDIVKWSKIIKDAGIRAD